MPINSEWYEVTADYYNYNNGRWYENITMEKFFNIELAETYCLSHPMKDGNIYYCNFNIYYCNIDKNIRRKILY